MDKGLMAAMLGVIALCATSAIGDDAMPTRAQLYRTYTNCLLLQAAYFDDDKSDAGTIALAAMEACGSEFDKYALSLSGGTPNDATDKLEQDFGGEKHAVAVMKVLEERRERRLVSKSKSTH